MLKVHRKAEQKNNESLILNVKAKFNFYYAMPILYIWIVVRNLGIERRVWLALNFIIRRKSMERVIVVCAMVDIVSGNVRNKVKFTFLLGLLNIDKCGWQEGKYRPEKRSLNRMHYISWYRKPLNQTYQLQGPSFDVGWASLFWEFEHESTNSPLSWMCSGSQNGYARRTSVHRDPVKKLN